MTGETLEDLLRTTSRSGWKEPDLCDRREVHLPNIHPETKVQMRSLDGVENVCYHI